jgi:plastocyanin
MTGRHSARPVRLALAAWWAPALVIGAAATWASHPMLITEAIAAPKPVAAATPRLVTIDGFAFKPSTITVKAGESIEWRNDDPVPHTATSKAAGLDSGSIAAGGTYRFTAKKKGRFDYICTFHPVMKGEIVVE